MLIAERVQRHLPPLTRFNDIELLDETDSTNRVVAARATDGAADGLVVAAEVQTAGRGRLDRSWDADAGTALLVSVLLRPVAVPLTRWYLYTAAAGLAARHACAQLAGFRPDLKWPNDLLVDGRKLAGILAESAGGALVVGLGCNVHAAPPGAISVDASAGRRIDRSDLLGVWLAELDARLVAWDTLAGDYQAACSTVGRRVVVTRGNDSVVGLAERIDDDGRLVVLLAGGPVEVVSAGDVTHVRPERGTWAGDTD